MFGHRPSSSRANLRSRFHVSARRLHGKRTHRHLHRPHPCHLRTGSIRRDRLSDSCSRPWGWSCRATPRPEPVRSGSPPGQPSLWRGRLPAGRSRSRPPLAAGRRQPRSWCARLRPAPSGGCRARPRPRLGRRRDRRPPHSPARSGARPRRSRPGRRTRGTGAPARRRPAPRRQASRCPWSPRWPRKRATQRPSLPRSTQQPAAAGRPGVQQPWSMPRSTTEATPLQQGMHVVAFGNPSFSRVSRRWMALEGLAA
mmetsp:Transcript_105129/g.339056  ORF Transcript_105129/g.339056 Transcript_105129/m.339056 type:complete len:255 (+) Transcript_105129:1395-2159(+)